MTNILIVCTTNNDDHRTSSWQTDRIGARDNAQVGRFVREVVEDCKRRGDGSMVTEVCIFAGGTLTRHTGKVDVDALLGTQA